MEAWTTIRYLHAQGKGIRAITRELGLSRKTVRRALRSTERPQYQRPPRPNPHLVPFEARIRSWYFREHLIGSRILRELQALGYQGSASALYSYLRSLRAEVPARQATMRFETAPGQQAQFDWSPYTVELGGERTKVIVYSLTLGYSRRKHYTASLDETQMSVFEAVEAGLRHFGGAPKELLVDNAKVFVLDANPAHFRWHPQFLELCGHYRVKPRACQPYRAQTKGKVERPFFYLEQHFIKGRTFASFAAFLEALAAFERDDLDVRVHSTTQEPPLARFAAEAPHLTSLPTTRFLGSLALSRKVSWDCLISYRGSRYSVPARYAGQLVWLLVSRGTHLLVLDAERTVIAAHTLSATKGLTLTQEAHYAPLRRGPARTYVVLAEQFLARFPDHAAFLRGLTTQHQGNTTVHLRGVLELALLYDTARLEHAFAVAQEYQTYSHGFIRGLLEHGGPPQPPVGPPPLPPLTGRPLPATAVRCDLGRYQQLLEGTR